MCVYWKVLCKCLTLTCGYKMGDVFPPVRSAKLKIVYGSKRANCQFRHYFHSNFLHLPKWNPECTCTRCIPPCTTKDVHHTALHCTYINGIHVHVYVNFFTIDSTQGKLPQRLNTLPRLPPVTLEEWERFREDWGRIDTENELKFKNRVFYGIYCRLWLLSTCVYKHKW